MKYKKHISLSLLFVLIGSFSIAQTFMVLEKMGTKKKYMYYIGESIDYKIKGKKTITEGVITNILDSAFVSNSDTIQFSEISKINIKYKRKLNIINTAGPTFIVSGIALLAIDAVNRGLIQEGDYYWDSSIGTISAALITTGALIIILRKDKVNLKENGWWRLRKAAIY